MPNNGTLTVRERAEDLFRGASTEGEHGPLATTLAGVAVSAITGLAGGAAGMYLYSLYSNGTGADGLDFKIPALITAASTFFPGYNHQVPIGYKAVPVFLNQRRTWFILKEGRHWLPPGLMGAINVDCREQPSRKPVMDDDAISSDKIKMEGRFFWTYQIVDPHLYLSKADPEKTLDGVGEAAIRSVFAGKTADELILPETKSEVSTYLLDKMQTAAKRYGISVPVAILTEALPPPEVLAENAKRLIEEAQRAYEKFEMEGVIDRIKQLKAEGFSAKEAYEVIATERKKVITTRTIQQFDIPEAVLETLKDVVGQLFGRRP